MVRNRSRTTRLCLEQLEDRTLLSAFIDPTHLVHEWNFSTGTANDLVGTANGTLFGGATISGGMLQLNGTSAYMATASGASLSTPLSAKTLVAWVSPATLNQSGGSALTVENTSDPDTFDAIDYAERVPNQWMAGSDAWQRSAADNGGAAETVTSPVMIAIVYAADNSITLYRNGVLYGGPYTQGTLVTYPVATTNFLIGVRHDDVIGQGRGYLQGAVADAQVWDTPLSAADIQNLYLAGSNGIWHPTVSTSTTIASSRNPASVGQAVTFTATVSSAPSTAKSTGIVTFLDGTTLLGSSPIVNGSASLTTTSLAVGTHPNITAVYSGDDTFLSSTSVPLSETVNQFIGTSVDHFRLIAPHRITAGEAFHFTVVAEDVSGSPVTDFTGTIHFASQDEQATVPCDFTFTVADQGSHQFTAILRTAGPQSLTVSLLDDDSVAGSAHIRVHPAAFDHFFIEAPETTVAGKTFQFTVTAQDAFGNTIKDYTGTVDFASSDDQATLADSFTFTQDDQGSHSFEATLRTAGGQCITATDEDGPSLTSSAQIDVAHDALDHFAVVAPETVKAGEPFEVTIITQDEFGNTVDDYTGTVSFDSTDLQATLPEDYTFTQDNQGSHTFRIVVASECEQTVTVSDTNDPCVTGSADVLVVTNVERETTLPRVPTVLVHGRSLADDRPLSARPAGTEIWQETGGAPLRGARDDAGADGYALSPAVQQDIFADAAFSQHHRLTSV
jgi:hypothetical protein